MLDKSSDVSRLVDKLYEKKLVDRKENPADRRQKEIEITQLGLDMLTGMDDCEKKTDTLLKNLNTEEVSLLNSLLDKIRE
jgi:DNA-binding MarR family transcriptional regulator